MIAKLSLRWNSGREFVNREEIDTIRESYEKSYDNIRNSTRELIERRRELFIRIKLSFQVRMELTERAGSHFNRR